MTLLNEIVIRYNDLTYKLGWIEQGDDGSLYIFLPRNERKNGKVQYQRTSIHTTGRINYHTKSNKKIFIEPLVSLSKCSFVAGLYIPSLEYLDLLKETFLVNGIVFNIPFNTVISIMFFISQNNEILREVNNAISINITDNIKFIMSINNIKFDERCGNQIMIYYPTYSDYNHQLINRYEAKRLYINTLYKNDDFKIIGPDKEGILEVVFETVMHEVPLLKIILADPNQYIEPIRGSKVHLQFIIKNKRYGNGIVKKSKYIKIEKVMVSCEPGIEETEEGKDMIKFDNTW